MVGPRIRRMAVLLGVVTLLGLGGTPVLAHGGHASGLGAPVDPSTLIPEPPPGAECWSVGKATVQCKTFKDFDFDAEPVFDVACGTVYETSRDHRDGLRWYVNGLAEKRFVHGFMTGTWSLSPSGGGKVVKISNDWVSWSTWETPGDDDTVLETSVGLQFRATAPGLGNAILQKGTVYPDGSTRGIKNGIDDDGNLTPRAIDALSKVLCP